MRVMAEWATWHHHDPTAVGYWPRLANGVDTYTSVGFVRGRALRYTENLYPPVPVAIALSVVADDLPPRRARVHDAASPPGPSRVPQGPRGGGGAGRAP